MRGGWYLFKRALCFSERTPSYFGKTRNFLEIRPFFARWGCGREGFMCWSFFSFRSIRKNSDVYVFFRMRAWYVLFFERLKKGTLLYRYKKKTGAAVSFYVL